MQLLSFLYHVSESTAASEAIAKSDAVKIKCRDSFFIIKPDLEPLGIQITSRLA
jgi:hypothetical protein